LLTLAVVHNEPRIAFIRLPTIEFKQRAFLAQMTNALDLNLL
jgi:hypothetical protein